MEIILPTLSGEGWASNPDTIMTQLFSYAVLSNKSQSTLFDKQVTSLPYLIAVHSTVPSELCSNIKKALETLYGRYFTTVEVIVRSSIQDFSGESQYEIYITITADGISLNKALGVAGNKLLELIKETQT
jgi:hypothetical protein